MKSKERNGLVSIVLVLFILSTIVVGATGCKRTVKTVAAEKKQEVKELRYQGWAGQVGIAELAEDLGYLGDLKLKWVGNTISGPQDIQAVGSKDIDFGGAFGTAIVNLKVSKAPIKWVIGSGGNNDKTFNELAVLESSPIKNARDLINKKVGVNTLAAHNEIVLKEYLRKEGLTDDEINKVTLVVLPPANVEQTIRLKQIDAAFIGGIWKDKAHEKGGIRALTSDTEVLGEITSSGIVMHDNFIKQNPNTTKAFIAALAKAIEWSKVNSKETVIARFQDIIKKRNRNEDATATKYWKSYGVATKGGLILEKDVQKWIDLLITDGKLEKGQLKATDLYTNEFNPTKE